MILQKKLQLVVSTKTYFFFRHKRSVVEKLSGYILGKVGTVGGDFPFLSIYLMEKIYLQIYLQKRFTKNFCQTIEGHITHLPISPHCEKV